MFFGERRINDALITREAGRNGNAVVSASKINLHIITVIIRCGLTAPGSCEKLTQSK